MDVMEYPATTRSPDCLLGVERSALGQTWRARCADERLIATLSQQHGISDLLARILAGRGIGVEEAAAYLSPSLRDSLPDPLHLKDMDKAVARIADAVQAGETIGVFGDYDVDGATSSALLARYGAMVRMPVHVHIPDRRTEGYGPNIGGLRGLKEKGASLVLTVDCGTVAFEPLAQARAEGIGVIVLDHHIGAAQLPEAIAVVNPNRLDESSPCGALAAVGVVFLLLVALNRELRQRGYFTNRNEPDLLSLLDLVALGTVCDVVPLKGLNRAFVAQGIKVMQRRGNTGLAALIDHARIDQAMHAYHLGFLLGPRINAGGRVGRAPLGSSLLCTGDAGEAAAMAEELGRYNDERKAIEGMVLEQAVMQAEAQDNRAFLMVAGEGWHPGVIGIVAGRLKERFERPAAVLAIEDGVAKASARSVPGVNLGAAVGAARDADLLLAGGGHSMAAGFSLETEKIPALHAFFEERLGAEVAAHLSGRHVSLDGCVTVEGLRAELAHELRRAEPFGMGNPGPRFAVAGARIVHGDIVKESHLKLLLADAAGGTARVRAMAFRAVGTPLGDMLMSAKGRPLHLAGQLKLDYWQGKEQLSFHIEDAAMALANTTL